MFKHQAAYDGKATLHPLIRQMEYSLQSYIYGFDHVFVFTKKNCTSKQKVYIKLRSCFDEVSKPVRILFYLALQLVIGSRNINKEYWYTICCRNCIAGFGDEGTFARLSCDLASHVVV